jgi:arylformamidase
MVKNFKNSSSRLIDISLSVSESLPTWPDSVGVRVTREKAIKEGAEANVTRLDIDVHSGTHVESSLHFFSDGRPVNDISLDIFFGLALVVHLPEVDEVGAKELEQLKLPKQKPIRLLLRTKNSDLWVKSSHKFSENYVGLTKDGAKWVVDNGIRLIGIDYLSVAKYKDANEVHKILLGNDLIILEGLDLSHAPADQYELLCFPLKVVNAEAAPARALLRVFN